MNGVIGMASLLLDTDLTAEQHDTAETIQASAEALLSLVNDLLDFEDRSRGMTLDPPTSTRASSWTIVVDLLAEQAWSHGLDLTAEIDDAVPARAHADPSRLRQILVNLVGNAIVHRTRRRPGPSATSADGASLLRIDVADTASAFPRRPRRASSRRSPR